MAKPRKASKRRPKSTATWQPVLTPGQLLMLAQRDIANASDLLLDLKQHLDAYDLAEVRSLVKKAHAAAVSGVGLVALAHEREAANA